MRKGQITVFIILGIVIVAAIGLLVVYKDALMGKKIADIEGIGTLSPELKEAGEVIEDCIEDIAKVGLVNLGLHGGYVDNSGQEVFDYAGLDVTYLYYDKENKVPSKEDMAASLSAHITVNAGECLSLVSEGFDVSSSEIKDVIVDISADEVDVAVEWPVTFKKGSMEDKVDGFTVSIPVRLGTLHNEITTFMIAQVENPDEICLSCLIESGQREDFSIELNNFITTYVFIIKDRSSTLEDRPYEFIFANSY